MKVSIIGAGYVGLVTAACLSQFGFTVLCMDKDKEKIDMIKSSHIPIFEPHLEEIIKDNVISNRLNFTSNIEEAINFGDIIFIAVGTPTLKNNIPDIKSVLEVSKSIAKYINSYKVIVIKSTVPVGTCMFIKQNISDILRKLNKNIEFDVVSNPEFLREGTAVKDFMKPDRIVIGAENKKAIEIMKKIYKIQLMMDYPFIITNLETAELIKYASNGFLSTKISYINEISNLCDLCNADVDMISKAMGLDKRIGNSFLKPGPGYGGSCFPKDTKAMLYIGEKLGYIPKIIKSTVEVNENQKYNMIKKIKSIIGNLNGLTLTALGTSFKPGTDDIRESPSIYIIKELLKYDLIIKIHDPKAIDNTIKELGTKKLKYYSNLYDACFKSDCIIIFTDWDDFKNIDFTNLIKIVRKPILIDLRNIYEPLYVKNHGFLYEGVGRL